ncbi:YIP1 family protein [Larsenimonas rhizosphaerae]|uniref:YIP1 family protein n=1 Tax=Larsenimonas rhizosphaerae TaxID=2944682 RepID=A0AA41ZGL6_9GAMM|nr:YIP1 family protein [Larsenimonas rhizosphaerae]MCM2131761.1 YIP1 family protein [Larsenimonas rhizosphaerae]MCX2524912.1 YIP1 family protein [Larsenimonas rhizosphaerae]
MSHTLHDHRRSPWLALWVRPRHTLRSLLKSRNAFSTRLLLAGVLGIVLMTELAAVQGLGLRHGALYLLVWCLPGGLLCGIAGLYLFNGVTCLVSRAMKGRGDWADTLSILTWTNVPLCVVALATLVQLNIAGMDYFMAGGAIVEHPATLALTFAKWIMVLLAARVGVVGISLVQRCSARRAASILLVSLLIMALITGAVFWGLEILFSLM